MIMFEKTYWPLALATIILAFIQAESAPTQTVNGHQDRPAISQQDNFGSHQPDNAQSADVVAADQQAALTKEPVAQPAAAAAPAEDHLATQETGYHLANHGHHHNSYPAHPTGGYHNSDADYGYDSGKNSYAKQAADWSLYDQGQHGHHDKYGDRAYSDKGHNSHSSQGKHDSYGNNYNSQGANHGQGYYSRDRGYGYEKHYAYDKEVASKNHADSHSSYGANQGNHNQYGNSASNAHARYGHDRGGQLSRYGNHGYGKKGSQLAAHHDYGQNQNLNNYHSQNSYPTSYSSSYSSHSPTYKSIHHDYSPQFGGYPSSFPSYY